MIFPTSEHGNSILPIRGGGGGRLKNCSCSWLLSFSLPAPLLSPPPCHPQQQIPLLPTSDYIRIWLLLPCGLHPSLTTGVQPQWMSLCPLKKPARSCLRLSPTSFVSLTPRHESLSLLCSPQLPHPFFFSRALFTIEPSTYLLDYKLIIFPPSPQENVSSTEQDTVAFTAALLLSSARQIIGA